MPSIIKPILLKGFRDFLPADEIIRRQCIRSLEDHFKSCGYVPIDTPALEYAEILLSKGGGETEKQIYRFTDNGNRDVALRFDLTVPFARYVATHRNEITMPFKRYHFGKVWRGENTQRGRYREFTQCDFDIVGSDSPAADLEILLMMIDGLKTINAGESRIQFSHRSFLSGLLTQNNLENKTTEILRILDKLGKIGNEEVKKQISGITSPKVASRFMDFITPEENNQATLEKIRTLVGKEGASAVIRLQAILDAVNAMNQGNVLTLNPSIVRGLDYYTGIVFETFLEDAPEIGSVCSGGRYDNLAGLFMKESISGVGASIGLDRLMAAMQEIRSFDRIPPSAEVLILMLDETLLPVYHSIAQELRTSGLAVEVYPEAKKLAQQFKYAEIRNIPLAIVLGPEEMEHNVMNLKNLNTRENYNSLTIDLVKKRIRDILESQRVIFPHGRS